MYTIPPDPDKQPHPSSNTSSGQKTALAGQILRLLQEEFVVRFPAFPEVFGQLIFVPFSQTAAFGTDGIHLYYDPSLLCAEFVRSPSRVKHAYLHVHIHCLCLHMFQARNTDPEPQKNLWDLACDLEAERMTRLLLNDGSDPLAGQPESMLFGLSPSETEAFLQKNKGSGSDYLNASALLPFLQASPALRGLAAQCSCDTHRFWYEDGPEENNGSPEQARASAGDEPGSRHSLAGARAFLPGMQEVLTDQWLRQRRRLKTLFSDKTGQRSGRAGSAAEDASLKKRDEMDYRKFLHQFAVPREERILDTDSFDYIPYCYGLTYYENMPFLEPLEYSEVNRLDEVAIAIDTSGSCSGRIVRRFLEETWNILRQKENFFPRMRLHLIQCDSMIQDHQIFTSVEQWEEALPRLKIQGLGNTDFRPVFDYLNTLIRKKEIRRLRGLLYFTDGDGIYPRTPPPFATAFVFLNRRLEKQKIPDWGIRLNLDLPEDIL